MTRLLPLLAAALALACLTGCAGTTGDQDQPAVAIEAAGSGSPPETDATPAAPSARVEVPDLFGETASRARRRLKRRGLRVKLRPSPAVDARLCDVIDQSEIGEVDEGARVVLTIDWESAPTDGGGSTEPSPSGDSGAPCEPSYPNQCLDPNKGDYDCAGGSGDGPNYVDGPITVDHSAGSDPFDLDRDGDGTGCE